MATRNPFPQEAPAERAPFWLWPNMISLDAPLVAVLWLGAFGTAFSAPLGIAHFVVLFFCVWCLYTTDRLIDAMKLKAGDVSPGLQTHRHHFMWRRARLFAFLLFFVGFIGAFLAVTHMERPIFGAGMMVMVAAVAYFGAFVSPLGNKKPLPGKEVAGGILFAAGTTLPVFADYSGTLPVIPAVALFGALCALNLLMIASNEGDLPSGRWFRWLLILAGIALVMTAVGFAIFGTTVATAPMLRPLYFLVALSAGALTILQAARDSASRDAFRVLADVALLTPLVPAAWLLG